MGVQLVVIVLMALLQARGGNIHDVVGSFGSRNVLGGYVSLMIPLMLGLVLCRGIWPTVVAALPLVLLAFGANFSGGSVVAITAAMLVIGMARGYRSFLVVALALLVWHLFIGPSRDDPYYRF